MNWRRLLGSLIIATCLFILIFFAVIGVFYVAFKGGAPITFRGNIGVVEISGIISDPKEILEDLVRFEKENNIRAIVLRIESPGGMVGAAQEIYKEVIRTRQTKKVVASLGSVAASGGYYVACGADRIVSNPGTITGSIGVIMEFTNYQDLLSWAKIKPKVIKSGLRKDIGSPVREMTSEEQAILQDLIDQVHEQFIKAVAEGRSLDINVVKTLSDGRIFTGESAMEKGLVDSLGNFQDAVDVAADLVGVEKPQVVYPPKRRPSFFEYLLGSVSSSVTESLNQISTPSLMFLMPQFGR